MTDKTMTLEQVREEIRKYSGFGLNRIDDETMQEWTDAITRHLSQPAERGEAVAWEHRDVIDGKPTGWQKCGRDTYLYWSTPENSSRGVAEVRQLYTAPPPAAGLPERWEEKHDDHERRRAFGLGWNACREAMISASPSPTIDVAALRSISEILRAVSKSCDQWRSSDSSNPSTLNISLLADKLARAIGDAK